MFCNWISGSTNRLCTHWHFRFNFDRITGQTNNLNEKIMPNSRLLKELTNSIKSTGGIFFYEAKGKNRTNILGLVSRLASNDSELLSSQERTIIGYYSQTTKLLCHQKIPHFCVIWWKVVSDVRTFYAQNLEISHYS
jgi:hypothetical protein